MYSTKLAAALSGTSVRQLRYWRRDNGSGPLLVPEYSHSTPAMYSYRDVVAIRVCVKLRQETSLQRVRRAFNYIQSESPETHLASHTLVIVGSSIAWQTADGEYIDAVDRPGQPTIRVVIDQVLGKFQTSSGRNVPDLRQPAAGITINSDVRSGYPVAEGSRVPFDSIAGLARDGLTAADIISLYPTVSRKAVRGAVELADLVENAGALVVA